MKEFFTILFGYVLTPFLIGMYWYTNHFGFIFVYDLMLFILSCFLLSVSAILFYVKDSPGAFLDPNGGKALERLKAINNQPWWKTFITYTYWFVPFLYLVYLEFYGSTILLVFYICSALLLRSAIAAVLNTQTKIYDESSKS